MPVSIEFAVSCQYDSADGIEIPTELCVGNQKVELIARLDRGAAHCIFERRYGEELGLDVESGRAKRFRTMAGSFVAYEHEVTIHTLGSFRRPPSSLTTQVLTGISWAGLVGLTVCALGSLTMIANSF